MKIAVLGTGNVGGTLGSRWAQKGHKVVFGSREPSSERVQKLLKNAGRETKAVSLEQSVADAEVVVLACPWTAVQGILETVGDLREKILIDCINPLNADFSGLDLGFSISASEQIAQWAPGAHVVKAFNSVSARTMADPNYGGQKATLFFCGDDAEAKSKVSQLAEDLDFESVDAGPLKNARYIEPLAMLYIHLAVREGWGSNCAFKILKR